MLRVHITQSYITYLLFKRRLVAFKGGFVGPSVCRSVRRSVCPQKFFKKFLNRDFVNPIDMGLVSTYEYTPEQFLNLTQVPKIAPFGPKKHQTTKKFDQQ